MKKKSKTKKTRKPAPKTSAGPTRSPERAQRPSADETTTHEVERVLLARALEGNVTAQIYWLCNRQPERWKSNSRVPMRDSARTLSFTDFMRSAGDAPEGMLDGDQD